MLNALVQAAGGALPARLPSLLRREFLQRLIGAPLADAALQLLGQPAAAAAAPAAPVPPPSVGLLENYDTWLCMERAWLRWERHRPAVDFLEPVFRDRRTGEIVERGPAMRHEDNAAGGFDYDAPLPSTRAGLVLATVGIDWRADER